MLIVCFVGVGVDVGVVGCVVLWRFVVLCVFVAGREKCDSSKFRQNRTIPANEILFGVRKLRGPK
jgi:hypothetical protein